LLAPIWLLGVVIYRWQWPQTMPESLAWICLLASGLLFAAFEHFQVSEAVAEQMKAVLGPRWFRELTFSRWFLTDYLLAGIVFLNFVGMRRVIFRFAPLFHAIERPVRAAAAYTFSIYILHQPLIFFFAALFDRPPTGYLKYLAVMSGVVLSIVLIGHLTERKRFALRRWLLALSEGRNVRLLGQQGR